MNLKGKKIVVIGGSSGIGKAVSQLAFDQGAQVVLTSRDALRAEQVAAEIGNTVTGSKLDINDENQIKAFFSSISAIDHIYIAAGTTKLGAITEGRIEDNMRAFDTRVLGSLRTVQAIVDKINPHGSVVFTGGLSTDRPISGAWVSGLATSTAEQLARVLVKELPHIRFNAVAPGYTDTPMWDTVLGDNKQQVFTEVATSLPVKQLASSEQVASAVIFLMANHAITGEVIHVDGGARLV